MTIAIVVVASIAVLCLVGAGYLLGAKLGVAARNRLRDHVVASHRAAEGAARELEERDRGIGDARQVIEALRAEVLEREKELAADRARAHELDSRVREQQRALERLGSFEGVERRLSAALAPLATQEKQLRHLENDLRALNSAVGDRRDESVTLRQDLERYLTPLAERDRIGKELAALRIGDSRQDLPRLLESMIERAGLASVLVSDEVGLPVAVGGNPAHAETIAGASSLLLTYSDRLVQGGLPAPLSLSLQDQANQMVVHRIFHAQGRRYVLTAVTRGTGVAPASLEPALDKLERILARDAWA